MAWTTVLAQADGANPTAWSTIVLAVLGSSAIGAVVGGFLTAWYRGHFEREEAWRTRLIDAADEWATTNNTSLNVAHTALANWAQDQGAILDTSGQLTEWASELRARFDATREVSVPNLARLSLLFGTDSQPLQAAVASGNNIREAVWIMSREPGILERHGLDPQDYDEINKTCHRFADAAVDANDDFARAASSVIKGETLTGHWRWG